MGTEPTAARAPVRVRRRRSAGWRMPPGAVYVGRPTKWGNPYGLLEDPTLERYRAHLQAELDAGRLDLEELRGLDLACWCRLDRACHGDILLELANAPPDSARVELLRAGAIVRPAAPRPPSGRRRS